MTIFPTQLDYSNVHLIGHSLGSHICGFAGERIPGLGRITGKLQVKKSLKLAQGQTEPVYGRTDYTN
jgi:pimeloyl-ACP methyl ester carboxylesterase